MNFTKVSQSLSPDLYASIYFSHVRLKIEFQFCIYTINFKLIWTMHIIYVRFGVQTSTTTKNLSIRFGLIEDDGLLHEIKN